MSTIDLGNLAAKAREACRSSSGKKVSIRDYPAGTRLLCKRTVTMAFDDSEAFTAQAEYVVGSMHLDCDPAHVRLINNQGASHRMNLEHLTRFFQRHTPESKIGESTDAQEPGAGISDVLVETPLSQSDAVERNIQLIREAGRTDGEPMSTAQMLMVGLATCQPKLIEDACYPQLDARAAWQALDEAQQQAILDWWDLQ